MIFNYAGRILLSLFCLAPVYAIGQAAAPYMVKGILSDSATGQAIEFATIAVTDEADKKVVALTYSDENGLFKSSDLKQGKFSLRFSLVGYMEKTLLFAVGPDNTGADLGRVHLRRDIVQLEAVTVTGSRPLVEQQPGMLVYNAERDISNQGGTAADVLRKAPILNVDAAGNVSMRGNRNLRILINGKYSGQMARSAADALNMMPANVIRAVEVITSPSARYDAEGAAGVINIITKKGYQSVSGTLEGVAGNLEQALNPRISVNKGKWNLVSHLHIHRFRTRSESVLDRRTYSEGQQTGAVTQYMVKDNGKPHASGDFQVEFAPDSSQLFNFSVNGWLGQWPDGHTQRYARYDGGGALLETFRQIVETRSPTFGADLNLGYTRKFRRPGEELYLMAQHSNYAEGFFYDAVRRNDEDIAVYREVNDNHYGNSEWTLQSDYVFPFGRQYRHAIESGVKMIWRSNTSDYDVQASVEDDPLTVVRVPSATDVFDYRQQVLAGYGQLKLKGPAGWALHVGLRLEGTFLEGRQRRLQHAFSNDFWNLVPSATLFKRLDPQSNLTWSYTKRISRPSIWDLNPNLNAQDPQNLVVGNPTLRPEALHQAEFTYALQTESDFFLNASLFGRRTGNAIESIVQVGDDGVALSSRQNLASNARYGLNLSAAVRVLPGWKINSNANFRFARFKSQALQIDHRGAGWGLNVNSSWKLPARISVQAYADYDARSITLQGFEGAWFYYSFSARKEFPARKLNLTLTTVSPFGSYLSRKEVMQNTGFRSERMDKYMMRSVRLSLNWEFGGSFKDGKSRKINNDDQKTQKKSG